MIAECAVSIFNTTCSCAVTIYYIGGGEEYKMCADISQMYCSLGKPSTDTTNQNSLFCQSSETQQYYSTNTVSCFKESTIII